MDKAHRFRLNRILNGEIPCGSSEARTLGIMLIAEVLEELRSIRGSLATLSDKTEPDALPPVEQKAIDPAALLQGKLSEIKKKIAACEDSKALAGCLDIENARSRPRATVRSALEARIQSLM